jgi:hypothetical protein
MKKTVIVCALILTLCAPAAAKVTDLLIELKDGQSFTGQVTGYQYSYQNNAVIVRIFATEAKTAKKMTALITFQAGNDHQPDPQILMNALSLTPGTNFSVRVFNADGSVQAKGIFGIAIVGNLRPIGGVEITPL